MTHLYEFQKSGTGHKWFLFIQDQSDNWPVFLPYFYKVKVGILSPIQQPETYWDRFSAMPLVGLEPTEVTACD